MTSNPPSAAAATAAETSKHVIHNRSATTRVNSSGNFPAVGSLLGDFFCLGKLGKGTFCSIHKCINLGYWEDTSRGRIVAAKVELSNFTNSGVLMGEAFMLQRLNQSLPDRTVPHYFGHLVSENAAAIVMEFLEGNDMHQLREGLGSRRISVEDAVFLTANVLVPLLQKLHESGVVHRDVKPSNCVRKTGREFLLVDFGLSKSIMVEKDSPVAREKFNETHSFRQEREKADFRGTSMYASLRVHQLKDYAFRDDMWSVLYVFCDLVSGGLPWMCHAAARDRQTCEKLKLEFYENKKADALLMGETYYLAKYKRDKMLEEGRTEGLVELPEPLSISKDSKKVQLLQEAFDHVGSLGFTEKPDYDLIQRCLKGFVEGDTHDAQVPRIEWKTKKRRSFSPDREQKDKLGDKLPRWELVDVYDPIDTLDIWKDSQSQVDPEEYKGLEGEDSDLCRLPVDIQFRIAQMEYNMSHDKIPMHIALRDFLKCAIPIVYGEWDAIKFEKDNHKQSGYRREIFLKVVEKCIKCADRYENFSARDCYYDGSKRRKVNSSLGDRTTISKVIFGLHQARREEVKKRRAPPPVLSFGQS